MSKRFGKKRVPGCSCDYNFTCRECLRDAIPAGLPQHGAMLDDGRTLVNLTDAELRVRSFQAWDACQGDDLRKLRSEAVERGVRVA